MLRLSECTNVTFVYKLYQSEGTEQSIINCPAGSGLSVNRCAVVECPARSGQCQKVCRRRTSSQIRPDCQQVCRLAETFSTSQSDRDTTQVRRDTQVNTEKLHQVRQCKYSLTLRCVRVTIVAVEKHRSFRFYSVGSHKFTIVTVI